MGFKVGCKPLQWLKGSGSQWPQPVETSLSRALMQIKWMREILSATSATPVSPHCSKGLPSGACRGLPVLRGWPSCCIDYLLTGFFPYLHSIFITMSLSVPAACFLIIQIKLNWIFSMCCERKRSEKKLCLLGQYLHRPAGRTASVLEMSPVWTAEQCQAGSGPNKDGSCNHIQVRLLYFWVRGLVNKGRMQLL